LLKLIAMSNRASSLSHAAMRVSASFQIIPRHVGRLWSGPRVGAGGGLPQGVFSLGRLSAGGVVSRGVI